MVYKDKILRLNKPHAALVNLIQEKCLCMIHSEPPNQSYLICLRTPEREFSLIHYICIFFSIRNLGGDIQKHQQILNKMRLLKPTSCQCL